MSEEEIIKKANELLVRVTSGYRLAMVDNVDLVLQALLDLYNKEKETIREITQYCKKDLTFERRLEREKQSIDDYNRGRFDTSESILNIIEE